MKITILKPTLPRYIFQKSKCYELYVHVKLQSHLIILQGKFKRASFRGITLGSVHKFILIE